MGNKTPLYDAHVQQQAKLVDFGGWDMPIHFGSQLEEHHTVRRDAGVFDVSHMTVIDITGDGARDFLRHLLANDINRLKLPGQAMYSAMCNASGHILDDLIVYDNASGSSKETGNNFLMVVNCATREKDLAWIKQVASGFACEIAERPDLAILAVQGPNAISRVNELLSPERKNAASALKVFQGVWCQDWFIARTGYTGEKGYEIILPETDAPDFYAALLDAGIAPIGLGARDTLRLEAGMNLYGSDMDESVTPFESNMAGTVVLDDRDFIGADALRAQLETGGFAQLVGLVMTERGVLRAHYPVFIGDEPAGEITSGAFSPSLGYSIALARVTGELDKRDVVFVEIRGRKHEVQVVTPPFVRNGKQVYKV